LCCLYVSAFYGGVTYNATLYARTRTRGSAHAEKSKRVLLRHHWRSLPLGGAFLLLPCLCLCGTRGETAARGHLAGVRSLAHFNVLLARFAYRTPLNALQACVLYLSTATANDMFLTCATLRGTITAILYLYCLFEFPVVYRRLDNAPFWDVCLLH
jgi:hypothetical protein